MKSKLVFLTVVALSTIVLSSCNKSESPTGSENLEQSKQTNQQEKPSDIPDQNGRQGMDLTAAATKLGVTEAALKKALGMDEITEVRETITPGAKPSGRPSGAPKQPDLATAAKTLGVSETALKEALGMVETGGPQGN